MCRHHIISLATTITTTASNTETACVKCRQRRRRVLSWESHLLGELERHRADIYERLYRAAPAARRGRDYDMSNFFGEYISL